MFAWVVFLFFFWVRGGCADTLRPRGRHTDLAAIPSVRLLGARVIQDYWLLTRLHPVPSQSALCKPYLLSMSLHHLFDLSTPIHHFSRNTQEPVPYILFFFCFFLACLISVFDFCSSFLLEFTLSVILHVLGPLNQACNLQGWK